MLLRLSRHTFLWFANDYPPLPLYCTWSSWDNHNTGYIAFHSFIVRPFWLVIIKTIPTPVKLKRLGLSPL
jgi:hypothetical protein